MINDRHLMTLHEVADLLNVPNEYVERLLRDGQVPVRGAGTEARVPVEDALAFKERRDGERRDGLRGLSQMTQDFGGYDSEVR
jgi:excisionase family DNA binding protein